MKSGEDEGNGNNNRYGDDASVGGLCAGTDDGSFVELGPDDGL